MNSRRLARNGAMLTALAILAPGLSFCSACRRATNVENASPSAPQPLPELPTLTDFPFDSLESAVQTQITKAMYNVERTPMDADANGRLAMLFHAYDLNHLADSCYRRATMLDGEEKSWHYYLGLITFESGDFSIAADHFDEFLHDRPDDVPALLELADTVFADNKLENALNLYRRVIDLDESAAAAVAHCGIGQILSRRGHDEDAVVHLTQALTIAPKYGKARYVLGHALRKLGRLDEARKELRLAEEQSEQAPIYDNPLRQALTDLVTGAIESLHHGIDLLNEGRIDEAIPLLAAAVGASPDLAEARVNLGTALLQRGDLDEAALHLRQAVELNPNYVQALYNLGLISHRQGLYGEAARLFEAALSIRPDHFESHRAMGTVLPKLARAAEAISHLRAAIELQPDDARPYKQVSQLLSMRGAFAEAIDVLRRGRARIADDLSVTDRLAWMLATCPDAFLRDGEEALELAQEVCTTSEFRIPKAVDTLAAALANAGRFEEAEAMALKAIELAKASGDAAFASEIESRLGGYRRGTPYRQPQP